MAAMIRHCDALFGSHFGGDTDRTHQSQQTPKAKPPKSSEFSWPGTAHSDSLIAARQYPAGAENQSTGPDGLNTHHLQLDAQALHKPGLGNKPLGLLRRHSMSSHSSGSESGVGVRHENRLSSDSMPASPKRRQGSFGRTSKEQPWLLGSKPAQADKALQKDRFR